MASNVTLEAGRIAVGSSGLGVPATPSPNRQRGSFGIRLCATQGAQAVRRWRPTVPSGRHPADHATTCM